MTERLPPAYWAVGYLRYTKDDAVQTWTPQEMFLRVCVKEQLEEVKSN